MSAAQRQWIRVAGGAQTGDEIAAAADRMCLELHHGLSRWIGVEGYATLQDRALRQVLLEHPALSRLSFAGGDVQESIAAVRELGVKEVSDGMVALVAAVIELLGRIIGADLALRLVEHWGDRARAELGAP